MKIRLKLQRERKNRSQTEFTGVFSNAGVHIIPPDSAPLPLRGCSSRHRPEDHSLLWWGWFPCR
jgi:hypothetical protein